METIEAAIQAVSTAPRVTMADITGNIAAEYVTTADKAFNGCPLLPPMSLLTICVLVLKNGFTVTGTSACASPENFDAVIGQRIAREDAIRQMWPLMGYQLKEHLFQCSLPPPQQFGDPVPGTARFEIGITPEGKHVYREGVTGQPMPDWKT